MKHGKFNEKFEAEMIRFYSYLIDKEATCAEVTIALGIYRPNGCYYKARYEKEKVLIVTGKRRCSITGFPAATLTTDPAKVAEYYHGQPQLKLAI
jgi:hypothetical protein